MVKERGGESITTPTMNNICLFVCENRFEVPNTVFHRINDLLCKIVYFLNTKLSASQCLKK